MQTIFNIINIPLGYALEFLSRLFGGNFAASVFFFTLLINLVLLPLSIKSQKSSIQQTRIKPKMDELKKKYGDDKQKYQEATQRLYQEEGISMGGGCAPMILRLVIMMSIYYLIMQPLTYLLHIDASVIKAATDALGNSSARGTELQIVEAVKSGALSSSAFPDIANNIGSLNFNFFGIDLTQTPKFSFDIFHDAKLIWLMPIIAFLSQMLSSVISMKIQKKANPEAPNMAVMMLTMPLISLFIGFSLPAGMTFYWSCSSLIGGLIQAGVQNYYGPHRMLASERAKELLKVCESETKQIDKFKTSSDDSAEND